MQDDELLRYLSSISDNPTAEPRKYRSIAPLDFHFRQNCNTFFEEELYTYGIALFSEILTSNAVVKDDYARPVHIPPPQIIALLSTLIVYPPLTSQLPDNGKPEEADQAADYLCLLTNLVGARNADLVNALTFRGRSRAGRRSIKSEDLDNDEQVLTNPVATRLSLYRQADDFWSVVGWAFNCAHLHPQRWDRWRRWLEVMLDIFQHDMEHRLRTGESSDDAVLTLYLRADRGGFAGRVLRAIFANGTSTEFPEVWRKETVPPKEAGFRKLITHKSDMGSGEDDFPQDSDDDDEERRGTTDRVRANRGHAALRLAAANQFSHGPDSTNYDSHRVIDSIKMRKRLLALIMAHILKDDAFMSPLACIDGLVDKIITLPLDAFMLYVTPVTEFLPLHETACMLSVLCGKLLVTTLNDEVTLDVLTKDYLPHAAHEHSVSANVKLSLCLEMLLSMVAEAGLDSVDPCKVEKACVDEEAPTHKEQSGTRMTPAHIDAGRADGATPVPSIKRRRSSRVSRADTSAKATPTGTPKRHSRSVKKKSEPATPLQPDLDSTHKSGVTYGPQSSAHRFNLRSTPLKSLIGNDSPVASPADILGTLSQRSDPSDMVALAPTIRRLQRQRTIVSVTRTKEIKRRPNRMSGVSHESSSTSTTPMSEGNRTSATPTGKRHRAKKPSAKARQSVNAQTGKSSGTTRSLRDESRSDVDMAESVVAMETERDALKRRLMQALAEGIAQRTEWSRVPADGSATPPEESALAMLHASARRMHDIVETLFYA